MKICSKCGHENEDYYRFCSVCGTELGEEIKEGAKDEGKAPKAKTINKKVIFVVGACITMGLGALVLIVMLLVAGKMLTSVNKKSITQGTLVADYNTEIKNAPSKRRKRVSESEYINAAETLVKDVLLKPDSAEYNNKKVLEKDEYGRAIVYLDVSAQNGLGMIIRQAYYVCINGFDKDDKDVFFYENPGWYTNDSDQMSVLKDVNDWGVDPKEIDAEPLYLLDAKKIPESARVQDGTRKKGTSLYKYGIYDADIFLYVDKETEVVRSVCIEFENWGKQKADYEKVIATLFGVMMDKSKKDGDKLLNELIDYPNKKIQADGSSKQWTGSYYMESARLIGSNSIYKNGIAFEAKEDENTIRISATFMERKEYKSGKYWSPLHDGEN